MSRVASLRVSLLCNEGYAHRPAAVECSVVGSSAGNAAAPATLPRADGSVPCSPEDTTTCNAFELGYCYCYYGQFPRCQSGCIRDADCGAGYVCACSGPSDHGGECQASNCTMDAASSFSGVESHGAA